MDSVREVTLYTCVKARTHPSDKLPCPRRIKLLPRSQLRGEDYVVSNCECILSKDVKTKSHGFSVDKGASAISQADRNDG